MTEAEAFTQIATRLTASGPKRILSLDGGGTRGIVTIAFLERIEATLQAELKRGDDYVVGLFRSHRRHLGRVNPGHAARHGRARLDAA